MRTTTRARLAGLLGGLAVLTLAGAALAQGVSGTITVYNAQHVSLTKEWVEGFTKETGVKVVLRNGSDTELGNQIVQEGQASPADVFLTENSPSVALVDSAGLLEKLPEEVLNKVPANFRPSNGHWIGIAARSTVFVYDKRKLKEADLPKSLMDLADPKWKGRWAASPAGADFQAIISAVLQLQGEAKTVEWLKAMKTNAQIFRGNSAAMKGVNDGLAEAAVIYHYYYYGDQAKTGENSKNVGLHFFRNKDPGAFVSISGGGVLATSKNKPAAEAFIRWIVGKGGQQVLREGDSYEYAISTGAKSNDKLVPLEELNPPAVEPATLNSKKVVELMMQAGLL
jgi:iron(III) transport system substrate-binding protein